MTGQTAKIPKARRGGRHLGDIPPKNKYYFLFKGFYLVKVGEKCWEWKWEDNAVLVSLRAGLHQSPFKGIQIERSTKFSLSLLFQMHLSSMIIQMCKFKKYAYKMSAIFCMTGSKPAFGRQGLSGSLGWYTLGIVSTPPFAPSVLSSALNQQNIFCHFSVRDWLLTQGPDDTSTKMSLI